MPSPAKFSLISLLVLLGVGSICPRIQSQPPAQVPAAEGRRLEVLFLGSENLFNHDPVARFRVIRKALGPRGINFTYTDRTSSLSRENLARYDVLLIFANQYTIEEEEQQALLEFSRGGGGCVLLHCAAGCFRKSDFPEYVDLLGAKFKSHGSGVFRARIVAPEHELMAGWEGFECWDETYVHQQHGEGRTILQRRDDEPWTWVKNYGEGRVFYTASGHDHRCWDLPPFHELIWRAVRWSAGEEEAEVFDSLGLPELEYRQAAVPKDPEDPVGPNNQLQLPLPPAESLKLAQIPPGFELKVFASEPMVVNPIAINWDHRGRLWVVEAFDYPNKVASADPQDRIKILEDTDRDGVADRVTVFAEKLNICTSVLPMHDGAIATDGERMVYLRDLDGDDRADRKDVLFEGLGQKDTHACTSNLRYGFDNWIYATVGYSGLDVTIAGERHRSGSGVFRFKPDGSGFEVLQNTTNNTWGLGFTDEGDVVGSTANGNPSWYLSIPNRFYQAAGLKPVKTPRADQNPLLFPITSDYFQNNPKEKVSSGAGHAIYHGQRFPAGWSNRRVLICEPPMHLVAAPVMERAGTGFETTGFEHNLYASADAWSAPVAAEPGPDGAVWIADWYNPICNHNPYRPHHKRGKGNGFVTDDRDRSHGRIYRIYPEGSRDTLFPDLSERDTAVKTLGHPSLFWRLAAQRMLVADIELAPAGQIFLELDKGAPASVHALRILEGQLIIQPDTLGRWAGKLLGDHSDRGSLMTALDVTPRTAAFAPAVTELLRNPGADPKSRIQAALFLAEIEPDLLLGEVFAQLLANDSTIVGDLRTAVGIAAIRHPEGFLRKAIELGAQAESLEPFVRKALQGGKVSPGLLAFVRDSGNGFSELVSEGDEAGAVADRSESARRGAKLYLTSCVACHQPDGAGLAGVFPPLDGSARVIGKESALIKIVLHGLQGPLSSGGERYDGVMPGHGSLLVDQEIADVLNYVRGAWSNRSDELGAAQVKSVRQETAGRSEPWTVGELDETE